MSKLTMQQKTVDEPPELTVARIVSKPSTLAAVTTCHFSKREFGEIELDSMVKSIDEQVKAVSSGDMTRSEEMLISQAHALDAIFNRMALLADRQEQIKSYDAMFRLALKAQSQCVRTLEVLAAIKNPPVVYAKQANISAGHQQINNGMPTHTSKIEKQKNELLEHTHGERLDTRTTSTTSGTNQDMETVGAIYRT